MFWWINKDKCKQKLKWFFRDQPYGFCLAVVLLIAITILISASVGDKFSQTALNVVAGVNITGAIATCSLACYGFYETFKNKGQNQKGDVIIAFVVLFFGILLSVDSYILISQI